MDKLRQSTYNNQTSNVTPAGRWRTRNYAKRGASKLISSAAYGETTWTFLNEDQQRNWCYQSAYGGLSHDAMQNLRTKLNASHLPTRSPNFSPIELSEHLKQQLPSISAAARETVMPSCQSQQGEPLSPMI
jgi:hypothetical protein